MKVKKKNDKRSKESIKQRQQSDCYITLIRKGRIVVQDGGPIKK